MAPNSIVSNESLLRFSVFASVTDHKSVDARGTTWPELVEMIQSPKVHASKRACPLLKLATFGDRPNDKGNLRHDGNVDQVFGIEADYDAELVTPAEGAALLRAAGVRAVIYTSASHGVINAPKSKGGPRWRVLAPLAGPVAPAERAELVSLINGALGGILAGESWVLSQTYYFGAVKGVAYEVHVVEGEPIDTHALIGADWEPIGPPVSVREAHQPVKARVTGDADSAEVAHLDAAGWLTGGNRDDGAVNVRCPRGELHTSDTGPSSTTYFPAGVGGCSEGGFECRHQSCGKPTTTEFQQASGLLAVATRAAFDLVTLDVKDAADAAIARARNAEKAAKQMPPIVLETQRERAARIGREGDRAPLPTQRVMTGSEMLDELVLLEEGTRVSRVSNPRYVLAFEEFRKSTAGSVEITKNEAGRKLKMHRAQLWLESSDRKTVRTQTFAPGRAALCLSPDNVPAQNLWMPRTGAAPVNWRELSAPFFEHVAYLVPVAAERNRFLDWAAHIEQVPGELPSTHYLMVASQTGIGRNWLAYALARAFAGHTALGFDLSAALKSGFNGSLSMKLLAVVDELHEGGPGGAHTPAAEKLKSMLTEATRLINPKHGRQHTEFNCSRFLMFSNHAAALPLADNDRRVIVIENPSERRNEAYFRGLYALLDDPSLGPALAEALKQRDIGAFNPGAPAPMTEAKARTIRAGRSEVEQAVRDVAAEWASDCITSSRLTHVVGQALGGKTWSTQSACVAAGLVKYAGRVKVAGVASHVWVLRDPRGWCAAAPGEVAAEVERGQKAVDGAEFD